MFHNYQIKMTFDNQVSPIDKLVQMSEIDKSVELGEIDKPV